MKKLLFAAIVLAGCQSEKDRTWNAYTSKALECAELGVEVGSVAMLESQTGLDMIRSEYKSSKYIIYNNMYDSLCAVYDSMYLVYNKKRFECDSLSAAYELK